MTRFRLRPAVMADRADIQALIERSARGLNAGLYRPEQVEGALQGAFGVDTQLIEDGTYFVAEAQGRMIGSAGWSRRRTLYGGDAHGNRDASVLDPAREPAKIRAFFVDPGCARQGLGSALLAHCEAAAQAAGFTRFELMSTLPGIKFYASRGYVAGEPYQLPLASGVLLDLLPMRKSA